MRRSIVVAALALLLLPASAHAALPITFDALTGATGGPAWSGGTIVSNQFTPDGVTFVQDGLSTGYPFVANVGATKASSPSNVALSRCVGCGEFTHNVIRGVLPITQERVDVRVGIDYSIPVDIRVRLAAYDSTGTLIGTDTETVNTTNFRTLMSVDPFGTDNIASFRIFTFDSGDAGHRIGIDDVNLFGTGTGVPEIVLSADSANVRVRQGGSAQLPFNLFRVNGSSGDAALSVSSGSSGGLAVGFMPNPLTGTSTGPSTATFTATNTAALRTGSPMTIRAMPADLAVGVGNSDVALNVTVERAFQVVMPTTIAVPSCGSVTTNVQVIRAQSGFSDNVSLAITGLEAGYTATLGSTTVGAPPGGAFANLVPLTITRTGTGDPDGTSITVTGTSGALPASAASATVARVPGTISAITPTTVRAPRELQPGTPVTLSGTGFCDGVSVAFGNVNGTTMATPADISSDRTTLTVRVPRLATNGAVMVTNPDGAFSSTTLLTVASPRNTDAFKFNNYGGEGVGLSDLEYVYGAHQTNITLDLCWPFGCNIVTPIPSPLTGIYILISNAALEGKGSCYGIAVTSQQLASGRIPYSRFAPGTAGSVWGLNQASGPASGLRRHIRAWHSTQLSSEAIQEYVRVAGINALSGGSGVRAQLESELRAGRNPIVMIRDGGGGHVVVAHDVRSSGSGYAIDTYDPNLEFLTTENSDAGQHLAREDNSAITVQPGGNWTQRGAYEGGAWSGPSGNLVNVPMTRIPARPTMPTTLTGIFSLIVPFGDGGGDPVQVVDEGGKRLLDADGNLNTNAATRIQGAQVMSTFSGDDSSPVYLLPRTGTYTQRLRGTRAGTTGAAIAGPGFAAHVGGIRTARGATEEVTFDAAAGELQVDATRGGALRARLARGVRDAEFGADIQVKGGDGGDHEFGVHPRAGVSYDNGGRAASASITLTYSNDDGTPGAAVLPRVPVPAGGSVVAVPTAWGRLDASPVRMRVRDARGRTVATRVVRPRSAPRRVRSLAVTARTVRARVRVVRVRSSYANVPKAASVHVTVQVRRGNRVVAVRRIQVPARLARGTRTNAFRIALPPGTYSVRGAVGVVVRHGMTMQSSRATRAVRFVAR